MLTCHVISHISKLDQKINLTVRIVNKGIKKKYFKTFFSKISQKMKHFLPCDESQYIFYNHFSEIYNLFRDCYSFTWVFFFSFLLKFRVAY